MGQLKIISVSGATLHSACYFDFADLTYEDCWRGFGPRRHMSAYSDGEVYTNDESGRINHEIIFEVPDTILLQARDAAVAQFTGRDYILGFRDCVSFSVTVARACGLNVPRTNLTPYGLLDTLKSRNRYISYR